MTRLPSVDNIEVSSKVLVSFIRICAAVVLIGGVFCLSQASAQESCYGPPPGIISWWQGNGNANDTIGPNNGTLVGNAEFRQGKVGNAFYFDGNSFFQSPTTGLPTGSSPRTLELWVYAEQQVGGAWESFFAGYGMFGNYGQTYHLGVNWDDTPPSVFFSQWGTGIAYPLDMTGQWHHLAVTNDGNFATLYIDGVQVSSGYVDIDTAPGTSFYMGIPGTIPNRILQGLVDEVTVYNRVLSPEEIAGIHSAGSAGKCIQPTHQVIQELIYDYYQNALDRDPDQEGWDFWTSEVERIVSLGIDIREGFQALGKVFFNSTEYLSRGKSNEDFVTDLYETFLGRLPDDPGKAHWVNQLLAGLTRDMLITEFANCEEFRLYLQDMLGTTSTRPENNLVNDLYRGFLGRLPDSGGFNHWLKDNPAMNMRSAQCSGAAAVRSLTYQIALAFIQSNEYTNRQRNNNQYVEDLYNGILKRGADPAGYIHWVTFLNNHIYTRVQMLSEFTNSPEFQTRVQAVIDAGCLP